MNFVRAETLIQEITADGKVRDIVTQRVRSDAEKFAEAKEDIIRNLPEFKLARGDGEGSLSEAIKASGFEEDKEKPKEYTVYTMDEDEAEHYDKLEEKNREKTRTRLAENAMASAEFENERKRLRTDDGPDLMSRMHQQKAQMAADKQRTKAQPTAADRLRGRIAVVRPANASISTPAPVQAG